MASKLEKERGRFRNLLDSLNVESDRFTLPAIDDDDTTRTPDGWVKQRSRSVRFIAACLEGRDPEYISAGLYAALGEDGLKDLADEMEMQVIGFARSVVSSK